LLDRHKPGVIDDGDGRGFGAAPRDLGFTRLMKWTIAGIIIILLGMALFLL